MLQPPPPYWLRDSCFNGMRISLQFINTYPEFFNGKLEGNCGKFQRVIGDVVIIKNGFQMLEVPFKYLIPVRPEMAHQTVTTFDGPYKGHQSRGHRDWKKRPRVNFFLFWTLGGLTNYVIRHMSKYSDITSSTGDVCSFTTSSIPRHAMTVRKYVQPFPLVQFRLNNHFLWVSTTFHSHSKGYLRSPPFFFFGAQTWTN